MLIRKEHPCFIVFEGIDGSGKTTQSKLLWRLLLDNGYDCVWYREPSDSQWGKRIRDLSRNLESIPPQEELNFFMLDREWNVNNNILPALSKNKVVILDRYYYSTVCYQGARGLDREEILEESKKRFLLPDLVFLIDIEVEIALRRISENRGFTARLFEKEAFLEQVRQNYLQLREDNIHIIRGESPIETTFKQIKNLLGFPV